MDLAGDDGTGDCGCWPFHDKPVALAAVARWGEFAKLKNGTVGVRSTDVVGVCRECGLKEFEPRLEYVAVSELSE